MSRAVGSGSAAGGLLEVAEPMARIMETSDRIARAMREANGQPPVDGPEAEHEAVCVAFQLIIGHLYKGVAGDVVHGGMADGLAAVFASIGADCRWYAHAHRTFHELEDHIPRNNPSDIASMNPKGSA